MADDLRDRLAHLTLWDERRLTRRLEAAERRAGRSPSWPPSRQIWYGPSSASSAVGLPCRP